MAKNTQPTGKAIELRFIHGIRFLSEHMDLLQHRATTSATSAVLYFMSCLHILAMEKPS